MKNKFEKHPVIFWTSFIGSIASILGLLFYFIPSREKANPINSPKIYKQSQQNKNTQPSFTEGAWAQIGEIQTLSCDDEKKYIRETKASEVKEFFDEVPYFEHADKFKALFKGKWVKEPGWIGKVFRAPEPFNLDGKKWSMGIVEAETGAMFIVFTEQDISHLRKNDIVRATGSLNSYAMGVSSLYDATISEFTNKK